MLHKKVKNVKPHILTPPYKAMLGYLQVLLAFPGTAPYCVHAAGFPLQSLGVFKTLFSQIPHFQASPEFLTHCFNLGPTHGQVTMREASCSPLHMLSGHYYSYVQNTMSMKRFPGLSDFNYHTGVSPVWAFCIWLDRAKHKTLGLLAALLSRTNFKLRQQ